MGVGLLFGILVLFPDIKVALESIISVLLEATPMSSDFAELVFTTMPYWGLAVIVICAVLWMLGSRNKGA